MDGQLFCYIEQPVDHGLVVAVRKDIVPCLMANVEMRAEHRERIKVNPQVS
ncbi:MAG TPA: hypothetical protein VKU19_04150 [Bryobacteraceae bacterium]|nr:hypothetical protein [Bryobacteraceae bacterium]